MPYLTDFDQVLAQIKQLAQADLLWLDTEVADYTTKQPRLSLIQVLALPDSAIAEPVERITDQVWMLDVLDQPELVEAFVQQVMMNRAITKVFHNAKYDVRYLGQEKVQNVMCTLELANSIPYYQLPVPNRQLKTLVKALCQLDVCKEQQGSDWGQRPLTDEQLYYASLDPIYLAKIHHGLQAIAQQCQPNPESDNIAALIQKHQEIYAEWRTLNSEKEHLEQRLKAAMQVQQTLDCDYCSLEPKTRTTTKVAIAELVQFIHHHQLSLDFSITLTQPMQKQLGRSLQALTVETQDSTSWQLKLKSQDGETASSESLDRVN